MIVVVVVVVVVAISYPESSGFLVSGLAPRETLGAEIMD